MYVSNPDTGLGNFGIIPVSSDAYGYPVCSRTVKTHTDNRTLKFRFFIFEVSEVSGGGIEEKPVVFRRGLTAFPIIAHTFCETPVYRQRRYV